MKYITIPQPIELDFALDTAGNPMKYGLNDFLNEFVWSSVKWRDPTDPEMQFCALRLIDKFKLGMIGDVVALQDRDHEKLLRIAALQDEKLLPHLAVLVMKMLVVISSAKDEPPPQA